MKAVKVGLNTMRKHTGGGSVNTDEYLNFDWLNWLTPAAKLKADWLSCYFPNAGYDLGHPESVISKHSAFYPNPGMGDQDWDTWRTESAESP